MDAHAKMDYHLVSLTKMAELLARFQNPSEAINVMFDKEAQKGMEDNQKVIESLLKMVMLCGKQGLLSVAIEMTILFGQSRKTTTCKTMVTLSSLFVFEQKLMIFFEHIFKKAKFYSLIADEVTDVGNREQLSLSLRYILDEEVNEVFLDFVEVDRITGMQSCRA